MNNAIIISEKPKRCASIATGRIVALIKKTRPALDVPFKAYLYCNSVQKTNLNDYVYAHSTTGGRIDDWQGKVYAEFVCDKLEFFDEKVYEWAKEHPEKGYKTMSLDQFLSLSSLFSDMSKDEVHKYFPEYISAVIMHIKALKIYDTPKDLSEFYTTDKHGVCKPVGYFHRGWTYTEEL